MLLHIRDFASVCLQFEGSSLRQLMVRICRGRYTPVQRYSGELRQLLSQLFKVSPRDRPSVNSLLKQPLLHKRISKHLDPQVTHTHTHSQRHTHSQSHLPHTHRHTHHPLYIILLTLYSYHRFWGRSFTDNHQSQLTSTDLIFQMFTKPNAKL